MQISPAISRDRRTVSAAERSECEISARAAAIAYEPPEPIASVKLRGQPGWVTFSIDGTLAYPSSGDVFDTRTLGVITQLTDEEGRTAMSEKLLEIDCGGNYAGRAGDQFGIGRMTR